MVGEQWAILKAKTNLGALFKNVFLKIDYREERRERVR